MLGKFFTFRGIFTAILFITLGFSKVELEIENVDTDAGTLDIYMSNTAGCSYCAESIASVGSAEAADLNFNSDDWDDNKKDCEKPA